MTTLKWTHLRVPLLVCIFLPVCVSCHLGKHKCPPPNGSCVFDKKSSRPLSICRQPLTSSSSAFSCLPFYHAGSKQNQVCLDSHSYPHINMYGHTCRRTNESVRSCVSLTPSNTVSIVYLSFRFGNGIQLWPIKCHLFMYVELDEQHDSSLYQLSQTMITAFFNISVKAAHRKTVLVSSSSCVQYKIIYKKSAWGVYVIFRLYSRSYITIWIQNYCSV